MASLAHAAEDPKCLSPNPADWPPPARPFFMIAFDTSGSMITCTDPGHLQTSPSNPTGENKGCTAGYTPNSCGLEPNRINDGKCALRKMVQAFGEVDFGLMSFPFVNNCTGASSACGPYTNVDGSGSNDFSGPGTPGRCTLTTTGNSLGCPSNTETGGKVLVGLPILSAADQASKILAYTDDVCQTGDPQELLPVGSTPLYGLLNDARTQLRNNLSNLQPNCRPVNVILVTDGEESCNGTAISNLAKNIAADLYNAGFANSNDKRNIRVYPIGLANLSVGGKNALNAIAKSGQCANPADPACTAQALFANNEGELSIALSNIITNAIDPETCDNVDNNCNGCTDEGFTHYCNRNKKALQCCAWNNEAQRTSCLTNYRNSITSAQPQGDLTKLPCWDPAADAGKLAAEKSWLCVNPGEACDEVDNNCETTSVVANLSQNQADENFKKCGSPLKCPAAADSCVGSSKGVDDDCDGIVDNLPGSSVPGSACPGGCVPSTEVCDGKDNDCDGQIDNNVPTIPCGPPAGAGTPANCKGVLKCVGGQYSTTCELSPEPETCDGLDNDCNGKIDDGAPGSACTIPGKPGLKYQEDGFPLSACKKGTLACNAPASACSGYVGPSEEICDGIDNDCDGQVDEAPDGGGSLPGVGAACGNNIGACKPGTRQCVGGKFVCQGGVQPQPELCNGVDDNCNGINDDKESVFADAPPPDQLGCWTGLPIDTCPAGDVCPNPVAGSPSWCKPDQATCGGSGTLQVPCGPGSLSCQKSGNSYGYLCKGGLVPSKEVCDSADNDCNGQVDDGLTIDPKPCKTGCGDGTEVCKDGKISCSAPTPKNEECNNLDDNCNGLVDEGVTQPCSTECGSGVQICKEGVFGACSAPEKSAEVCDGLDNNCNGLVDEGSELDGTADPLDPSKVIGAPCGSSVGACKPGRYGCLGGKVVCLGAITPQEETCDGVDNDCDGTVDETDAQNPICATDQTCVKTSDGGAQCASRCGSGEFPCPSGKVTCQNVAASSPGVEGGAFCIAASACGDCATKTVAQNVGGKEQVLCAPSSAPGATPVPVCVCKDNQCRPPCAGVACDTPLVCTDFAPLPGACVDSSCFTVPCPGGQACDPNGACAKNPCIDSPCPDGQVCRPSDDLTTRTCTGSCAGVTCQTGEVCHDGKCQATQCPVGGCPAGQICDPDTQACVNTPDTCKGCKTGQVCNPSTKKCDAQPCDGVICPAGQACAAGECVTASGTGGSGGAAGASGASGQSGAAGTTGGTAGTAGTGAGTAGTGVVQPTAGAGGVKAPTVPIGQATGGGGCAYATGNGASEASAALSLLMAALPLVRRRSRREKGVR